MPVRDHPYLAVIVKPTYDCNMACRYCSVQGHDTSARMSFETVDRLFERVTEFCGKDKSIHLVWHGGEPSLMGAEFYEYIGRKTLEYADFRIANLLQTNALHLDGELVDTLLARDFKIGTSLDGPARLHDLARRDALGGPTFDTIMESLARLRARGVPIGAILVLNRLNRGHMPEIYEFFSQARIHLRVNPVQLHGRAACHPEDVTLSPREYGTEMITLFDLWYHDPDAPIMIDPFTTIITNAVTGDVQCCDFRRECHAEVISVGPTGGVYPCGQFSGEEQYNLGNIYTDSIGEIMATPAMHELLDRVPENIKACSVCEYSELCNCGCTASAVCRGRGIMQPDYYCPGRRMLFRHIFETVRADVRRASSLHVSSPAGQVDRPI